MERTKQKSAVPMTVTTEPLATASKCTTMYCKTNWVGFSENL